jgi:hypothetical protein
MSSPTQPANTPTPKPYLHTRSAHNVKLWIKQAVTEGRLKDCWNLGIDRVETKEEEDGNMVDTGESYFVPVCSHQSFESNFAHIDDDSQLAILQHNLNNAQISCPKNCTYYTNRKWGWLWFTAKRIIKGLYGTVQDLLKGFAGLNWQTQVALIVLLVLIIAPKWVPLIISLARAFWGKTP